ncbi:MAG: nucleotidyltransferase domain-containing protein [Nitrosomonadales bacterium]|nr:nucleotidyltransferase domain-containing protein [Nitrosomonadales bacterium]
MSDLYHDLSPSAQAAYAELFDVVRAHDLRRSVSDLNGSFASKGVKGRKYWYFQFRDIGGGVRQIYVGPDSAGLQALIAKIGSKPAQGVMPLAKAAVALGCARVIPAHFRIIRRLSEYGFFSAGGVLVGTHAFLAMGNMLGVSWNDSTGTQDVDFAHPGRNISIALPSAIKIDVHAAIESLAMGLLPITSFAGNAGATYINPSRPDLRVDFLTMRHRGGNAPVVIPNLNIALQPLKFMEFSMEHPVQMVIFCDEGAVTVNAPLPARYALHKLIVWGERSKAFRTKTNKDLRQAAALISYFAHHQPGELVQAWQDMVVRGKGWEKRVRDGVRALTLTYPDRPEFTSLATEAG